MLSGHRPERSEYVRCRGPEGSSAFGRGSTAGRPPEQCTPQIPAPSGSAENADPARTSITPSGPCDSYPAFRGPPVGRPPAKCLRPPRGRQNRPTEPADRAGRQNRPTEPADRTGRQDRPTEPADGTGRRTLEVVTPVQALMAPPSQLCDDNRITDKGSKDQISFHSCNSCDSWTKDPTVVFN